MRCQVGDVIEVTRKVINGLSDFFDQKSKWRAGRYVVVKALEEQGWHVTARMLREGLFNDERGRIIDFYQSGDHINCLTFVTIVDKISLEA